jgi:hypothetical protein
MGVNGQQPTLAQRIAAQTAQQQQRARPPVGAPIGSGPRANGTTAQIAQQQVRTDSISFSSASPLARYFTSVAQFRGYDLETKFADVIM